MRPNSPVADAEYSADSNCWDSGEPSLLVQGELSISRRHRTNRRGISRFSEASSSSRLSISREIVHPGEVNRVR